MREKYAFCPLSHQGARLLFVPYADSLPFLSLIRSPSGVEPGGDFLYLSVSGTKQKVVQENFQSVIINSERLKTTPGTISTIFNIDGPGRQKKGIIL